jgi:transposase-like protein
VLAKVNGETRYLWRDVDHEGEILESYFTKKRDKSTALRFFKKTLKRYSKPEVIVTDGLRRGSGRASSAKWRRVSVRLTEPPLDLRSNASESVTYARLGQ